MSSSDIVSVLYSADAGHHVGQLAHPRCAAAAGFPFWRQQLRLLFSRKKSGKMEESRPWWCGEEESGGESPAEAPKEVRSDDSPAKSDDSPKHFLSCKERRCLYRGPSTRPAFFSRLVMWGALSIDARFAGQFWSGSPSTMRHRRQMRTDWPSANVRSITERRQKSTGTTFVCARSTGRPCVPAFRSPVTLIHSLPDPERGEDDSTHTHRTCI